MQAHHRTRHRILWIALALGGIAILVIALTNPYRAEVRNLLEGAGVEEPAQTNEQP